MTNSLTRTKEPLVLPEFPRLRWYACGPTVYDVPHLGHASCFVKFDVIRRILTDYFHLDVTLVMSITDVDDKIIARALRERRTTHQIAQTYELAFMQSMAQLGVRPPTAAVRVAQHMDDIVRFIERLLANGSAYVAPSGSVYFDTARFRYHYGKLQPARQIVGDDEGDGEGDEANAGGCGSADALREKRHLQDFALWKARRAATAEAGAEPVWPAPWGPGRPGWHVECSAMCGHVFGRTLDLHTGGIDLMFPHHENSIAQCEAHYECPQWANYFLHSGHVRVCGAKMSKSLGNTVSISELLERHSARQFRLFCLLSPYAAHVDWTASSMDAAVRAERILVDFLAGFGTPPEGDDASREGIRWTAAEHELCTALSGARSCVHAALADDFDTPTAMHALLRLVHQVHAYQAVCAQQARPMDRLLMRECADYMDGILHLFGCETALSVGTRGRDRTLNALVDFRSHVRRAALTQLAEAGNAAERDAMLGLLALCDRVRDTTLPALGYRLRDFRDGRAIVSAVSKARPGGP